MNSSFWRWLAAVLVVGNIALWVLQVRLHPHDPAPEAMIPPLDPSLPQLVLLHERPAPERTVTADCFTIGPLNSLLAQQRAEDRLRATAGRVRGRQTDSERDRGWWVFMAAGTRPEALALTRQLAEEGLEDFFIVTRGDMENVVSVGLYENIDNARARQRQMLTRGFEAEMEVRRESVPQFWVDYQAETGMESAWRFILEGSPGAQRRSTPCWDD